MTESGLAALLPRGAALPRKAVARFENSVRTLGMHVHRFAGGALLATRGSAAAGRKAAVVGEVFGPAGGPTPELPSICAFLDRREGRAPDHGLWGDFLTVDGSSDKAATRFTRSPFGSLPCFWLDAGPYVLVGSSMALLEACALVRPTINWQRLAHFLLSPQMRNGSTCLQGCTSYLAAARSK